MASGAFSVNGDEVNVSNESPSCLSLLLWSPGNCLYSPSLGYLQDICFCQFGILAPTLEVVQCEFLGGGWGKLLEEIQFSEIR